MLFGEFTHGILWFLVSLFTKWITFSRMYVRSLAKILLEKMHKGKAIVLIGPRQVGKTTLIQNLLKGKNHLFLDGDDPIVRTQLENINTASLKRIIGKNTIVFIDEAQRIENIGLSSKIITDQFKNVQLILSGSSAFSMDNTVNESLTGRQWNFEMYPISWSEFESHHGFINAEQQLNDRLVYGMYPDVLNHPGEEREVLYNLVNSYLYKDILSIARIRKPEVLEKLVRALAYQMGSEVRYNELAQLVGVDKNTVMRYITILEQGYIIFKLGSFSRNLRNEIKRNQKIYFYDNGLRNMILGDFRKSTSRTDMGPLWENFLISERLKKIRYDRKLSKLYFWRTTQQQEIDCVEENEGTLTAYEFKWAVNSKARIPKTFTANYEAEGMVISPLNFRDFLEIE